MREKKANLYKELSKSILLPKKNSGALNMESLIKIKNHTDKYLVVEKPHGKTPHKKPQYPFTLDHIHKILDLSAMYRFQKLLPFTNTADQRYYYLMMQIVDPSIFQKIYGKSDLFIEDQLDKVAVKLCLATCPPTVYKLNHFKFSKSQHQKKYIQKQRELLQKYMENVQIEPNSNFKSFMKNFLTQLRADFKHIRSLLLKYFHRKRKITKQNIDKLEIYESRQQLLWELLEKADQDYLREENLQTTAIQLMDVANLYLINPQLQQARIVIEDWLDKFKKTIQKDYNKFLSDSKFDPTKHARFQKKKMEQAQEIYRTHKQNDIFYNNRLANSLQQQLGDITVKDVIYKETPEDQIDTAFFFCKELVSPLNEKYTLLGYLVKNQDDQKRKALPIIDRVFQDLILAKIQLKEIALFWLDQIKDDDRNYIESYYQQLFRKNILDTSLQFVTALATSRRDGLIRAMLHLLSWVKEQQNEEWESLLMLFPRDYNQDFATPVLDYLVRIATDEYVTQEQKDLFQTQQFNLSSMWVSELVTSYALRRLPRFKKSLDICIQQFSRISRWQALQQTILKLPTFLSNYPPSIQISDKLKEESLTSQQSYIYCRILLEASAKTQTSPVISGLFICYDKICNRYGISEFTSLLAGIHNGSSLIKAEDARVLLLSVCHFFCENIHDNPEIIAELVQEAQKGEIFGILCLSMMKLGSFFNKQIREFFNIPQREPSYELKARIN